MRHKWNLLAKGYGHETAKCENCGLLQVKRHAYNFHWTEWKRGDHFLETEKTPPCPGKEIEWSDEARSERHQ